MTPIEHYQQLVHLHKISVEDEQLDLVRKLQRLYEQLLEDEATSFWQKLFSKRKLIKGFYLWGSVGTGKTLMINNFFNCLPFQNKLRMHFHGFMQYVHYELKDHQGERDPLQKIAKNIRGAARILVLDELIVNDIADAMLLAELFQQLISQKITLVFTTNTPPDNLYLRGLQRQRFMPAIHLIKQHCEIYHLSLSQDFRQQHAGTTKNYLTPITEETFSLLEKKFREHAGDFTIHSDPIHIHGREVSIIKQANKTIWFDFKALCDIPRSQRDYLFLAKHYETIIISDLTKIPANENNLALSFIHLIDVLYDHHIRLIISAETAIDNLYTEGKLLLPFARTQSRLTEMQADRMDQSEDYPIT